MVNTNVLESEITDIFQQGAIFSVAAVGTDAVSLTPGLLNPHTKAGV
jgi:hypothetical protein